MLSVIGQVNARLLARLKTDDDAPYRDTDLNFTQTSTRAPTAFPTLSVVSLGEPTTGNDLEGTVQPGIISSIEMQAYSNKSLYEATELLDAAADVMLSMSYNLYYGQATLSDVKPYCKVARFRRVVGSGDKL